MSDTYTNTDEEGEEFVKTFTDDRTGEKYKQIYAPLADDIVIKPIATEKKYNFALEFHEIADINKLDIGYFFAGMFTLEQGRAVAASIEALLAVAQSPYTWVEGTKNYSALWDDMSEAVDKARKALRDEE